MRPRSCLGYAILLGTAIHLDWHLARGAHHGRLSGDWPLHWLVALPLFALLGLRLRREALPQRARVTACVVLGGVFGGQVLEPAYEVVTGGAGWSWMLHGPRWTACAEFLAAGLLAMLLVLALPRSGVETASGEH